MKAMVNISGEITKSHIIIQIPNSFFTDGKIDFEKLNKLGFYHPAYIESLCDCRLDIESTENEEARVKIKTKYIKAEINGICNVEVKIIRDYNLFQWIGFGALSLYRMIKRG